MVFGRAFVEFEKQLCLSLDINLLTVVTDAVHNFRHCTIRCSHIVGKCGYVQNCNVSVAEHNGDIELFGTYTISADGDDATNAQSAKEYPESNDNVLQNFHTFD